ncbi:SRPBCC domain-containing protein [Niallia taxi]|uniref:SRPBCC domain-containing protein n=1 Tax=Niallia taxi TaxID=2499688 RepID=UPI003D27B530
MLTEVTVKLQISKPAEEVFVALINPEKIGNYWFSSSSENWTEGNTVLLRYEEYQAEVAIRIMEVAEKKKIVFAWGEKHEETIVSITLKEHNLKTVLEVKESGFKEDDPLLVEKLLNQKEGWVYTLTCLKAYLEHGIHDLRASLVFG